MSNLAIAETLTFDDRWKLPQLPRKFQKSQEIPKPLVFDSPDDWEWSSLSALTTQLPLEDNETLESNQHRIAMNALIRSIRHHWAGRTDFFVGGNMFVYFNPAQQRKYDYRGPDFFVALGVNGSRTRQAWFVWEENGKLPDVIVELLSDSTKATDLGLKKTLYEQRFKTTDYFVFDPLDASYFRGWHLSPTTGQYEELVPNEQGWLWSAKLGFWVGVWEGTIEDDYRPWLRFYDADGQLVPLTEEAAEQKAQTAEQKAQTAEQKAQTAEQKAQTAEQMAKLAKQEAKQAKQKAKEASQRAEQLAEQLRRLGVDPDRLT